MRALHFQAHYAPSGRNKNLSRKTVKIFFMKLLAPLILENLEKIFEADPELWGFIIFGTNWSVYSNKFFQKNH